MCIFEREGYASRARMVEEDRMHNWNRLWIVSVALALAVAACGDSDDTGETTVAPDTTTTEAGATEDSDTLAGIAISAVDEGSDEAIYRACVVDGNLIRVAPAVSQQDIEDAGLSGTVLDSDNLREYVEEPIPDAEIANAVFERATYIDVGKMGSHAEVQAKLMEFEVLGETSPVYGMGFETLDWSFEPGAEAFRPATSDNDVVEGHLAAAYAPTADGETTVAIVDSGFPDLGVYGKSVALATQDEQDEAISHGAFVASVVRQIAPTSPIRGARVGLDLDNEYIGTAGLFESAQLRTELVVEFAIERLRRAIGGDTNTKVVLNLSLGTYDCGALLDGPPQGLRESLVEWASQVDLAIYAAAGNELTDKAFYPAAFAIVQGLSASLPITAVVAADVDGSVVRWDQTRRRLVGAPKPAYAMSAVAALGVDLIGVAVPDEIGKWSGSSFATAVMSGLAAAGPNVQVGQTEADALLAGITRSVMESDVNECRGPLVASPPTDGKQPQFAEATELACRQ